MPKTVAELSIWEDPPDFKYPLLVILIATFCCGSLMTALGASLLLEPDLFIAEILEGPHAEQTKFCRTVHLSNMDSLCPTLSKVYLSQAYVMGQWFYSQSMLIGSTGLIDVFITLLALLALYRHSKRIMFMTLLMIPIAITLKWKLVDLSIYPETPFHEYAKDELIDLYRESYMLNATSSNTFTRLFNTISVTSQCCGVRSSDDAKWEVGKIVTDRNGIDHVFQHPPACCSQAASAKGNVFVQSILNNQCLFSGKGGVASINTEGCYNTVFNHIYEKHGKHFVGLTIALIFLQSVQNMLSIVSLMKHTPIPPSPPEPTPYTSTNNSKIVTPKIQTPPTPPSPISPDPPSTTPSMESLDPPNLRHSLQNPRKTVTAPNPNPSSSPSPRHRASKSLQMMGSTLNMLTITKSKPSDLNKMSSMSVFRSSEQARASALRSKSSILIKRGMETAPTAHSYDSAIE